MKTEHIVLGGLALGGLALALSPEARKKTKKAVGLSDGGKKYDVVVYKVVQGETPKIKYNPFSKFYEADFLSHTDYYKKLEDAKDEMDNAGFVIKKEVKKTKKAVGLSDGGMKALTKLDKKVIMAFIDKRKADNKLLESTGKVLNGHWMGGSKIASWIDGKIRLHDLGSKKADQIHRFIKKESPRRDLE